MSAVGLLAMASIWTAVRFQRHNRRPSSFSSTAAQFWQRLEFCVTNVPTATNPFDPDVIRLDATFTLPSGKNDDHSGLLVSGLSARLSGGYEYLTRRVGSPQWRLRFTPPEPGSLPVNLTIQTNRPALRFTGRHEFHRASRCRPRRAPDTCRWRPTDSIFKPVTDRHCA